MKAFSFCKKISKSKIIFFFVLLASLRLGVLAQNASNNVLGNPAETTRDQTDASKNARNATRNNVLGNPAETTRDNASAQNAGDNVLGNPAETTRDQTDASKNARNATRNNVPLPNGYNSIELGMNLEEAKQALLRKPVFGYRGERDVSLLHGMDNHLIETIGNGFLSNCWFQFYNDSLYVISINLNTSQMDYYSVFTTLCNKYGNPILLNPEKAQWEDENVILALEKPLCLKYTDAKVYYQIIDESEVSESAIEFLRQGFLDSL